MDFLNRVKPFIQKHFITILLLGIVFGLFLLNSRYVDYPDEYINLLGGKVILNGGLPYRDFWDHHLPLAWYTSAILLFLPCCCLVLLGVVLDEVDAQAQAAPDYRSLPVLAVVDLARTG